MRSYYRIYHPTPLKTNEIVTLSESAARHVGTVLRLQSNDSLVLFCGDGIDYLGKIFSVQKKSVQVLIEKEVINNNESPLKIHLGQALARSEKMDFIVQKAVELGVNEITPLITQHCAIKYSSSQYEKKMAHWQGIIINACEQCGRSEIPVLHEPVALTEWLALPHANAIIFDPGATVLLKSIHHKPNQLSVLIGPEGGFAPTEIKLAQQQHFQLVKLGSRILRMETAAIAALSAVQLCWGDY